MTVADGRYGTGGARWTPFFATTVAALGLIAFLPVPFFVAEIWLDGMLGGVAAGLLTFPICLALGWLATRRAEWRLPEVERSGASWVMLALVALDLAGLALASSRWDAVMICGIALPPAVAVWIWGTFGFRRAAALSFPVLFGWFALPWEYFLHSLDLDLQEISADIAYWLLTPLGYPLEYWNSYTLYTHEYYVVVNETCSGMNMLVTLAMYTLVFGWATQKVVQNRLILLLMVPFMALFTNGARVAIIYLLGHYGGDEWAMGFWHTGSAYLIFIPMFYLLYVLGRFLDRRSRRRAATR